MLQKLKSLGLILIWDSYRFFVLPWSPSFLWTSLTAVEWHRLLLCVFVNVLNALQLVCFDSNSRAFSVTDGFAVWFVCFAGTDSGEKVLSMCPLPLLPTPCPLSIVLIQQISLNHQLLPTLSFDHCGLCMWLSLLQFPCIHGGWIILHSWKGHRGGEPLLTAKTVLQ